jgi:hypothetical protein
MKNLTEELNRMRELAGIIKEGSEQSTANTADGAQKPPTQTQSPSIGSPQIQKVGNTPKAKQPTPQVNTKEEIEELLYDESDYPPIVKH